MGISREGRHKRRETGGKRAQFRKKRKFEMGRPAANTKLAPKRIHLVRGRGGNLKFRAISLETGNFSWGSEVSTRKTKILDVVYNASNNELVRTKTLVKNSVVQIDATPFRQWYEQHYGVELGKKKVVKEDEKTTYAAVAAPAQTKSKRSTKLHEVRGKERELEQGLIEQFNSGRLLAVISSRPGQCGRSDGYILEGKELEFYQRQLAKKKKGAKADK